MPKLCLNSRDDLIILNLDHVAFFQANGNYTPPGLKGVFMRLGRSLIINKNFIITISVPKQKLYLGDYRNHLFNLTVPQPLLKALKEEIAASYGNRPAQTAKDTDQEPHTR